MHDLCYILLPLEELRTRNREEKTKREFFFGFVVVSAVVRRTSLRLGVRFLRQWLSKAVVFLTISIVSHILFCLNCS